MKEKIEFLQNRIKHDGIGFLEQTELQDIIKLRESFPLDVVDLVEKVLRHTSNTAKERETIFSQANEELV